MATHYQISPTATLVKDMIFGWCIRTEDRLVFFSDCDNLQLKKLQGIFAGNPIYEDVIKDITNLIATNANKEKRAAVAASVEAEESPPQRNEFTGIRERVNAAVAEQTARIDAMRVDAVRIDAMQDAFNAMQDEESQTQTRANVIIDLHMRIDAQLDTGCNPALLTNEKGHVYAKVFQMTNSWSSISNGPVHLFKAYQVVDAVSGRVRCEVPNTYEAAAYVATCWW